MSKQMNRVAALSLALVAALACRDAVAAEASKAPERSAPADRSAYFDEGAATSNDIRRVPVAAGEGVPKTSVVIRNARLFDATGAPARDATLVVVGNRISAILPPNATDWPQDAAVIDAGGATVMPGLVDLHTHTTYVLDFDGTPELTSESQADSALRGVERLRFYIESGITSIRDTGSHGMAPFILKQWSAEGRIAAPRIFPVGQVITAVGGHATEGFTLHTAPEYRGRDDSRGQRRG